MVARTLERSQGMARVLQVDISKPLNFADDAEFDVILAALCLHYLKDWQPVFREFQSILKPQGYLIFSVHHPFSEFQRAGEVYFQVEKRERANSAGSLVSYRRPLGYILASLKEARFQLEVLLEPQPQASYETVDAQGFQELMKSPGVLCLRARAC